MAIVVTSSNACTVYDRPIVACDTDAESRNAEAQLSSEIAEERIANNASTLAMPLIGTGAIGEASAVVQSFVRYGPTGALVVMAYMSHPDQGSPSALGAHESDTASPGVLINHTEGKPPKESGDTEGAETHVGDGSDADPVVAEVVGHITHLPYTVYNQDGSRTNRHDESE